MSYQKLIEQISNPNLAKSMSETEIDRIAMLSKSGYETDLDSRKDWVEKTKQGIKIAEQVMEEKTFPWPNASNVKFPLIAIAAIQFAARAYPSIIKDEQVVKAKTIGKDPDGSKAARASRISKHMSWQLIDEMDGWEEGLDRLLHCLPVVGTVFKKTYRDSINKKNESELCMPLNVVVHMDTKNLESCRRISHIIPLYKNEVIERQNAGEYIGNVEEYFVHDPDDDLAENFIEQHRWLDLDGDGYEEPYIVTFHEESGTLVRIVACYDENTILKSDDDKIIRIKKIEYFTAYFFIPSPSNKFYALGFAHLLGGINESLSTLINQLIDAGTMSNMQSGFLGKGINLKQGSVRFSPGEWKVADVAGGILKDNIFPLPASPPSSVLFQLLGLLHDVGMQLSSVSETMAGETPSQNTPATSTLAVIEQGLKVFTGIYKRIFRSLKSEFGKLHRLNALYIDEEQYFQILDEDNVVYADDYQIVDYNVLPIANPSFASDIQRLKKAQSLMETISINPTMEGKVKILSQFYEALDVEDVDELLPKDEQGNIKIPQPQPDPKALELQLKTIESQNEERRKVALEPLEQRKIEAEIAEIEARTANYLAQAQDKPIQTALQTITQQVQAMHNEIKLDIDRLKTQQMGAKNGQGSQAQPNAGPAGRMAPGPQNSPGSEILSGVAGAAQDPNVPGNNNILAELGPNAPEDNIPSGGDTGNRPYPPNTTRVTGEE